MKKILLLTALILIVLSACSNNISYESDIINSSASSFKNETTVESDYTVNEALSSLVERTEKDVGEGIITQEKYRQCYYNIPYQFSLLVDEDELKAWEKEIYSKDPNETNEMVIKLFVQHFNISKESFDRANLGLAKALYSPKSPVMINPKDYVNQEMYEIFNSDIIYTFDDEIINNYYLSGDYPFIYESEYEGAVESGEYVSRTEKWVDVEQMEAEINAKYGVPETTDQQTA